MCEQHIDRTEQLAARSQASAGFAGALCHGTNLPPPLVKHRQDQVGLFELRLVEDEHLRAICPGACHARRASLVLGVVAKAANLGLVIAPAGLDLHVQLQKDLRAKDALKIATGIDTDMLDHLAALADDDALLALALDVNRGVHAQHLLGLLERVADDANGVRNLITSAAQDLLAHELGHKGFVGRVGAHVLGEPTRALGQKVRNGLDKGIDVEVLDRRRHDLVVDIP